MGVLQRGYERLLTPIIGTPRPAYATVGVMMVGGMLALPLLGQSLLPTFKERDFLMHWITAPGTSVGEERRIVTQASRELGEIPGVRNFGSHIGQAFLSDEVAGVNFGENWISVDPSADVRRDRRRGGRGGGRLPRPVHRTVQTYLKERIDEVLTGSSDPIVVRIFGDDLEVLRSKADDVVDMLGGIDGVVEEHVELQVDMPQIEIEVELAAAERYGLKPGDVRRAAATMLAGEEVGDIFRDGKAYDVHVWSTPSLARQPAPTSAPCRSTRPRAGPCGSTTSPTCGSSPLPNTIHREDVLADDRGRRQRRGARPRLGRRGASQEGSRTMELPLGYHAEVLGEYAERQEADRAACSSGRPSPPSGSSCCCVASFRSGRLATLVVLHAADGARGRRAGRLLRRRHHLARLARRVLHDPRHRGPQRHHADQPLPAPRGAGGRDVRPRARAARRAGAAGADPDDRA